MVLRWVSLVIKTYNFGAH